MLMHQIKVNTCRWLPQALCKSWRTCTASQNINLLASHAVTVVTTDMDTIKNDRKHSS